jgi:hypothetical protein
MIVVKIKLLKRNLLVKRKYQKEIRNINKTVHVVTKLKKPSLLARKIKARIILLWYKKNHFQFIVIKINISKRIRGIVINVKNLNLHLNISINLQGKKVFH